MALGQQSKLKKPAVTTAESPQAPLGKGSNFLREVIVELKKTTWPTPKEAWRLTSVVIGVILSIAIYMGVIDYVLTKLTAYFHLIK